MSWYASRCRTLESGLGMEFQKTAWSLHITACHSSIPSVLLFFPPCSCRSATTDKAHDGEAERKEDDDWRGQLHDILNEFRTVCACRLSCFCPQHMACQLLDAWLIFFVLAADETSAAYLPKLKTYNPQANRRIYVPHDKRNITVTPVVAMSGEVVTVQVLCKGRTQLCEPRVTEYGFFLLSALFSFWSAGTTIVYILTMHRRNSRRPKPLTGCCNRWPW